MNIHFTGIKGMGMSSLAQIFKARGYNITGSDIEEEFPSDLPLKNAGIKVRPFSARNIKRKISFVIYSTAYNPDSHPELIKAKKRGIKIQSYSEALADVFNRYEKRVLIAGTHGKTTTTALLGLAFEKAGLDPTVIVGGQVIEWQNNVRVGKSDIIIAEGDEYQEKFLTMKPNVLLITNVDYDHPDYFETKEKYEEAFRKIILAVPRGGHIIAPISARNITFTKHFITGQKIFLHSSATLVEYDSAENIPEIEKIYSEISDFRQLNGFLLSGNIENIYAAKQVLKLVGGEEYLEKEIERFKGIKRRCEIYFKNSDESIIIIDDYAHHPTAVKNTLKMVKERYSEHEILVLFQPHTYSRTRGLMDEFVSSFKNADAVGILKTYSSQREIMNLSEDEYIELELASKINGVRKKKNAELLKNFSAAQEKVVAFLKNQPQAKKIVITMGAGDVWKIARDASKSFS